MIRLCSINITMNGIATITERGQVVIPQPIRESLGLKPSDKLFFKLEGDKITARPIPSLDEALGMIKAKKRVSQKEFKKVVVEAVVEKFQRK